MEMTKKYPFPGRLFDKSGSPSPDWIVVYDPNCIFIAGPLVIDPNCPWIVDPNCMVPDPNCYILDPDWPWIPGPLVPDPNCYTYIDPNENNSSDSDLPMFGEGWEYLGGSWRKWYPGYGWWYVNGIVATWISDIDDPNEVMVAMNLSQPYVFLCQFEVDEIASVQTFRHTGKVISKDDMGRKVSELPVEMYVWDISGKQVFLATWTFILPMEFPEQQGVYYDRWGNSYAAIYVPEGGHLEVTRDDFYGDFNYDGAVDNKDYGLFAVRWNESVFSPYDPNAPYDLMYDADYDGQTDISDLMQFSDNWLEIR